ncbi:hypothetical protein KC960_02890 [Candidatus Saccharibacteria bacterium]|nr:hypothetical protein [Candidatus Saccharibacteria bacterium]
MGDVIHVNFGGRQVPPEIEPTGSNGGTIELHSLAIANHAMNTKRILGLFSGYTRSRIAGNMSDKSVSFGTVMATDDPNPFGFIGFQSNKVGVDIIVTDNFANLFRPFVFPDENCELKASKFATFYCSALAIAACQPSLSNITLRRMKTGIDKEVWSRTGEANNDLLIHRFRFSAGCLFAILQCTPEEIPLATSLDAANLSVQEASMINPLPTNKLDLVLPLY